MSVRKRFFSLSLFLVIVLFLSPFSYNSEAFEYESKGKRDPFVPLVGAERPTAARLADITSIEDIRLDGIALGAKGEAAAIINGELIKTGAKVGDITVVSITKTMVTLDIVGKVHELKLPDEGGRKE